MDATPEIWRYRRWEVVLIACAPTPRPVVDWENYDPGLRTEIERLAAMGDCVALDEIKAEARESESDQIERTGTGNEDLTRFIDSELESTECAAVAGSAVSG